MPQTRQRQQQQHRQPAQEDVEEMIENLKNGENSYCTRYEVPEETYDTHQAKCKVRVNNRSCGFQATGLHGMVTHHLTVHPNNDFVFKPTDDEGRTRITGGSRQQTAGETTEGNTDTAAEALNGMRDPPTTPPRANANGSWTAQAKYALLSTLEDETIGPLYRDHLQKVQELREKELERLRKEVPTTADLQSEHDFYSQLNTRVTTLQEQKNAAEAEYTLFRDSTKRTLSDKRDFADQKVKMLEPEIEELKKQPAAQLAKSVTFDTKKRKLAEYLDVREANSVEKLKQIEQELKGVLDGRISDLTGVIKQRDEAKKSYDAKRKSADESTELLQRQRDLVGQTRIAITALNRKYPPSPASPASAAVQQAVLVNDGAGPSTS